MLCNKKEVAKVSASPGKTQMINHFTVTGTDKQEWYLVDLPGYGFAKVAQSQRKSWQKMIQDYIQKRPNLVNLFTLIDSRHEPQKADLEFINRLGEWQIPFAIVFTKADKTTQRETAKNVDKFLSSLQETWESLPPHFVTSAVKHLGKTPILRFIAEQNTVYAQHKKGLL